MTLHLRLVTPNRVLKDMEVLSIVLPTAEGEIAVYPQHAPLAALLVAGIIKIQEADTVEEVAVSGGYIRVEKDGSVNVLADTAEFGSELDLSAIEEAKQRAHDVMTHAAQKDDQTFAAAAAALERELARYRLAQKHHTKQKRHDVEGI